MHRRQFFKQGALAAAGLAAAAAPGKRPLEASTQASDNDTTGKTAEGGGSLVAGRLPGSSLKLSCAAYSFRDQLGGSSPSLTLEEFVDFCARQDLDAVELTSYYFRDTAPEYLARLRRRAYVNGLAISGTPVGNNFCHPPGPERAKEVQHVKTWIDHVVRLGSQAIRVFSGGAPKGRTEEEARAWAIECLREVAAYAGERGILLGLENHGGITSTADGLLALVRGVDSPWLGVNLDTGNFSVDPYGEMEKAAPYAVSVQVKVKVRGPGGKPEDADFARVVRILREAGYRGYLALEYEEAEEPMAAVPRHLKALREALG
jgi:sugar phosphate isomerase/epimerase